MLKEFYYLLNKISCDSRAIEESETLLAENLA
jgi:hypothetical protein